MQQSLEKQETQKLIDISTIAARIIALGGEAESLSITDNISMETAVEIRAQLKLCGKQIEEKRVKAVKPRNDEVKLINETCRPATQRVKRFVEIVDAKVLKRRREQEAAAAEARRKAEEEKRRLREEAEKKAREEADQRARKAAEKARQEAEEAGFTEAETQEYAGAVLADEQNKPIEVETPVPVMPAVAAPAKTVRTETGARSTVRKIPDFEVTDLAALAAAHPQVIEVKRGDVLKLYRSGASVQGVRFFLRDSVSG
jgi:membrane protein involved in colicin uptake